MNLSMKWLSDYVDINVAPREFAEAMTMSGSKVEGYKVEGDELSNVVVGKVISIEKHPNADTLFICMLDVGASEPVQIVTGAQNVFAGAIVPVALDNSTLPNGVKIKKGKLRGVESCGMLCSLGELKLTVNDFPYAIEDGIFIMQEECKIGEDIRTAIGLNDTTVEFEITSNRPDCLSVIGLAREAAVTFNKPISLKQPVVKGSNDGDNINNYLSVDVKNTELCTRYIAKIVKNIKIKPSPRWLRERLRASGVRAINNIVDITNYVMLEYGQPMHAFDYKYVDGKKIIVRNAFQGETITTLDSIERKLSPEMLVIADETKASAIAGVMGGEYSSIANDTNTIIFESACFMGSSVRITAKKVGLRTESSAKFEKGLDAQNCLPAINRACELIELLDAGEVVDGIIDVDNSNKKPATLKFEPEWINKFLGISLDKNEMIKILEQLDFSVSNDIITVPSFRADIEHKADIAEEIARIYGYNNIPTTALLGSAEGKLTDRQKFERKISDCLLAQGLNEVSTYSFISPKFYDKINLPADSILRKSVTITNPLGEDTSVMRTTTLPSMLDVIAKNYNNRNPYGYFFELSTEYIPTTPDKLPNEKMFITMGMYGGNCDFFDIKGIVEELFDNIDVYNWDIKAETENPSLHPGRSAKLFVNQAEIGLVGEIHPIVANNYGIETKVYVAKLDVDVLFENSKIEKQYKPLPKFPASTRDLAVLCDVEIPVIEIEKVISSSVGSILEKIDLFDVYKGKQVAENKKSVAFNIVMRAADRTLTDDDCDKAVNRILKALNQIGISLRS